MKQMVAFLMVFVLSNPICWAVEVAPGITDREIIERLTRIEDIKIKVKDFDQDKLARLVGAMRGFAEGNKEIADILKSFNLL